VCRKPLAKTPAMARLRESESSSNTNSQHALSSSHEGRGMLEDCYKNPYKYPTRQPLKKKMGRPRRTKKKAYKSWKRKTRSP